MGKLKPEQLSRIETLIKQLADYLDVRFELASRVNKNLKGIYEDMVYQHLELVHAVLEGSRAFGPQRFQVGDIFASTDQEKKNDLVDPMNQASIMSLMVVEKVESATDKKRAGMLDVHDLPTLYEALDPSTKSVMELIQMWVWWDLMDATFVRNFYVVQRKLQTLLSKEKVTAEGIAAVLAEPPKEMRMEELKEYDPTQETADMRVSRLFLSAVRIRNHFERERQNDETYKVILKRKEGGGISSEVHNLLLEGGRRLMAMDKVRQAKSIDETLVAHYGKAFKCANEEVTAERIVEHETKKVETMLPRLRMALEHGLVLGAPFNYKTEQCERMDSVIQSMRSSLQIDSAYVLPTFASEIQREHLDVGVSLSEEEEDDDGEDESPLSF